MREAVQVPSAPPSQANKVRDATNLTLALVALFVLFFGGLAALGLARRARVRRDRAERRRAVAPRVDPWVEAGRRLETPDEEGFQ